MAIYLPDSTSLILYGRRNAAVRAVLRRLLLDGHELGSCAVTIAEYYTGRPVGRDPDIDAFLSDLEYWEITRGDAVMAGNYRADYRRRGIQLQVTDTLIAALAARLGAIVLTENIKDFPMDDIQVESLLA